MEFAGRDFLQILDFSSEELRYMLEKLQTIQTNRSKSQIFSGQKHRFTL